MGTKEDMLFHTISIEDGNKTIYDMRIPLIIGFRCSSVEAIKKPMTIHMANAAKFASQLKPIMIIGMTSIIPAMIPNNMPINLLFISTRLD
jgi:hypothetical protein